MENRRWTSPLTALCAALLVVACGDDVSDEGIVARVGEYELTVDEAVELLVDEERLPAQAGVVESLAELWIDYTLLAEAMAEDSTLASLDVEPLVTRQLNQVMVFQLRDSVIQVDTFITDQELRVLYEEESPDVEMRARHIMLQLPAGAGQAARDSVRAQLETLREQLLQGADFATLARRYSQDPGTAPQGGDLGFFGRGDMVAAFEDAVLALEPGEVSGVVQSPMGMHLIRLEERRVRDFEEVAPQFRTRMQARMVQEAESVYVSGLVGQTTPQVTEGAVEIVRELAANPGAGLTGRAAGRELVEWDGGSVTVGDMRELLQVESPGLRQQVAEGSDELIEDFLQSLARREVLVREAESAGLRPARDSIDVLVDDARQQLVDAARRLGLGDLDPAPGEDMEIAIQRAVHDALQGNLTGATQVVPLGLVGFQLREGRSSAVLDAGIGEAIVEIARIRAARQLAPSEGIGMEPAVPDTTG